ncbi:MAG: hypothetical protein Q4Q06_04945 [Bacteroidota bacterium]|nr:hypothetical protein [Bacteroidota bacterium]
MIITFEDKDLEELIITGKNRKYKDIAKDFLLVKKIVKTYEILKHSENIKQVAQHSFLHYEKLRYGYSGKSSVRPFGSKRVERLIFEEKENKIEITILELDNTHYGNKK